jgi:DNA-3-methyladenine glycosylase
MPANKLPKEFYQAYDTLTLAQKLLGCELVHESPEGTTSGIIVETEAYLSDDPACHAYNRRTPRTEPMYAAPGTIYVYLIYGMYQCFNVVSNQEGTGEAVLIRALQPTVGTDLMEMRRKLVVRSGREMLSPKNIGLYELCRGPGKLVKAMGIEKSAHNNLHLTQAPLYIAGATIGDFDINSSVRIGINVGKDLPYRFSIRDNPFVSK